MKAITTEDAVLLSGLLSCFAAVVVAAAVADASAVEMAAATIAACGLSCCSSAAADSVVDAAVPSAHFHTACPKGQAPSYSANRQNTEQGAGKTSPYFIITAPFPLIGGRLLLP